MKPLPAKRRNGALTRERIIRASIELLDSEGETGLTFRLLAEKLATGPGAIYWHVASKNDLLTAACDSLVSRTMDGIRITTPQETIRAVALALFDLIDGHPWIGTALTISPGTQPVVRILEHIGQQIRALEVPVQQQWNAAGTLIGFMLGVSRQNAANRQLARTQGLDREQFLNAVATAWSQLDPAQNPFATSLAEKVRDHDDRADFAAGIDLILAGIPFPERKSRHPIQ